jgi:hypothetical protein
LANPLPAEYCYLVNAVVTLHEGFEALTAEYDAWRQSPSEEALHLVRIGFKKLRYHCEIFKPLYGTAMAPFIEKLRAAQESLGLWNDCRVLRDYVVNLTQEGPGASLTGAARLENIIHDDVERPLGTFGKTARAFFAGDQRDEARRLFDAPAKKCCNPTLAARERAGRA